MSLFLVIAMLLTMCPTNIAPKVSAAGGFTTKPMVEAGADYTVVLKSDGTVWAWGNNWWGQLGDGTYFTNRRNPVQINNLTNIIAVAAGGGYETGDGICGHTMALKSDGTVWGVGFNSYGQLGNGIQVDNDLPVPIAVTPVQAQNLDNITAVAAGGAHTVALRRDGTVWVWGNNFYGQL